MIHAYMLAVTQLGRSNGSKYMPPELAKANWCAGFVSWCCGIRPPVVAARAFLRLGARVELIDAQQGDIIVLRRGLLPWQGHVAFLDGFEPGAERVWVLGGNQGGKVCYKPYPVSSIIGIRRLTPSLDELK